MTEPISMTEHRPQQVPKDQLFQRIAQLEAENKQLRQENQDLHLSLTTTAEHGDTVEWQLYELNQKLELEVRERQLAEMTLHSLLSMITQERDDLEIIIQTIVEHGDILDLQWRQQLCVVQNLATIDSLTQVSNRRAFDQHLLHQWTHAARRRSPLTLILTDIDQFKPYNDTYGHIAGDHCLKQVAQALKATANRPADLLARYGGEEFALILPDTDEMGAIRVAERMQAAIASLKLEHESSSVAPYVTLSMGIACQVPDPGRSPTELIAVADQYLYVAKNQGRNQFVHRLTAQPEDSNL